MNMNMNILMIRQCMIVLGSTRRKHDKVHCGYSNAIYRSCT